MAILFNSKSFFARILCKGFAFVISNESFEEQHGMASRMQYKVGVKTMATATATSLAIL